MSVGRTRIRKERHEQDSFVGLQREKRIPFVNEEPDAPGTTADHDRGLCFKLFDEQITEEYRHNEKK